MANIACNDRPSLLLRFVIFELSELTETVENAPNVRLKKLYFWNFRHVYFPSSSYKLSGLSRETEIGPNSVAFLDEILKFTWNVRVALRIRTSLYTSQWTFVLAGMLNKKPFWRIFSLIFVFVFRAIAVESLVTKEVSWRNLCPTLQHPSTVQSKEKSAKHFRHIISSIICQNLTIVSKIYFLNTAR